MAKTYAPLYEINDYKEKLNAIDLIALKINEELLGSKENRGLFPVFTRVFRDWYKRWVPFKKSQNELLAEPIHQSKFDPLRENLDTWMSDGDNFDKRWRVLKSGIKSARMKRDKAIAERDKVVVLQKSKMGAGAAIIALGVGLFWFASARKK